MPINNDKQTIADIQHTLNQHIELLNMVLDAGQMNIWEWDLKTDKVVDFGHASSLSALPGKQPMGHIAKFFDNVIAEDRDKVRKKVDEAIHQSGEYQAEFRVQLEGTNQIDWISARGRVFHNAKGEPVKMIGVWVKITDQKKAEALAYQQHVTLTRIARLHSMGEMAASLAHELTQPLAVINTYLTGCVQRMQQSTYEKDDIIEAMKKAGDHVNLAGKIIHGMKRSQTFDASKIERQNINDVIREAIDIFKNQSKLDDFYICVCLDNADIYVELDKVQMIQVILNLLINSKEAILESRVPSPWINIESSMAENNMVRIRVSDNGPGIDQAYVENLFVPCFSTKTSGMGMGLAICRSIIEFHGGNISAFNLPKAGACFQVLLKISDFSKT